MEVLPYEIIEYILRDPSLSIFDVASVSSTCSKLRETVNSNGGLWRAKYFQRWPKTDFNVVCEDWRNECISRNHFEKHILDFVSKMSSKFFHFDIQNIGRRQFDFLNPLINDTQYSYYYLKDIVIGINSRPLTQSLTHKYYGNMLMRYMHKRHCKEMWNNFLKQNVEEQTLEKGAIFVALWWQEYDRGLLQVIISELDKIANLVRQHVLQNFQNHPLQNTSEETLLEWKNKNIQGNMFEPKDCESIIWAINHVLFKVLDFYVSYDYIDLDRKKLGIDFALLDKKANPLMFAVIYESTARRLGVKIEILDFYNHCLLRWKENYSVEESVTHYVSASTESIFIQSRCPKREGPKSTNLVIPCSMKLIAQRIARQMFPKEDSGDSHLLERDALELALEIQPTNLDCYQELSRLYRQTEMDAKELIQNLKGIRSQIPESDQRWFQAVLHPLEIYQKTWEYNNSPSRNRTQCAQKRVEGMEFAVGMIVRGKLCDRMGVIYGWSLSIHEEEEISQRAIYRVLVDDGTFQFVHQKNLQILHSPPLISHYAIGRYFDEYCTTFYKPNKELQAEYPEDMEALRDLLKKDRQT